MGRARDEGGGILNRDTFLNGVHTSDMGRIKTMQSNDSTKFYIELEFFNPLKVIELAELCKSGDIYGYACGLVQRLQPNTNNGQVFRDTDEGGGEWQLDDPSPVISENK